MLTCFLIRLITQIQSPFSFRQVTGQPRTCLSDHVLRTPTVHPRSPVPTPTDDKAAIRAEADSRDCALMGHAGDFLARGTLPDPRGRVPTAIKSPHTPTDDKAAIRAEADSRDRVLMGHAGDFLARGTLPDPRGPVPTATK